MNIREIEAYLRPYGMQMHEMFVEKDRRKRYYKLVYPIFAGNDPLPVSEAERLELRPKYIYQFAKNLLENTEYKEKCVFWVANY